MANILIVEDDELLAQTLEDILQSEGFACQIASSFEEALDLDFTHSFDLYLLDINLPTHNGLELLQTFRSSNIKKPAIFLTSHKEKEMIHDAFESGCDDYIKKPFDNDELIYRIKAVLSRFKPYTQKTIKIKDGILYDAKTLTITTPHTKEKITQKLARLLEIFLEHPNKIVTKEQIIDHVWSDGSQYSDGSLRVYITRLKNLLGKDALENTKGVGYRFKL
jgi:DNA-binding response OmpR family regulator